MDLPELHLILINYPIRVPYQRTEVNGCYLLTHILDTIRLNVTGNGVAQTSGLIV